VVQIEGVGIEAMVVVVGEAHLVTAMIIVEDAVVVGVMKDAREAGATAKNVKKGVKEAAVAIVPIDLSINVAQETAKTANVVETENAVKTMNEVKNANGVKTANTAANIAVNAAKTANVVVTVKEAETANVAGTANAVETVMAATKLDPFPRPTNH